MRFCQSKKAQRHEELRTVLSTGGGGESDLVVDVAIRRAHPSGLNTNDTLQSH